MQNLMDRLAKEFDPSVLVDSFALWLPNGLVAAATLAVFWLLHRVASRAVRFVMKRAEVDETARTFVETVVRYTMLTIALIMALGQLGVDVSGLLASLGVAGLTVGFAARDALSNLISGILIFWDRPFVIGDLVEVDGKYGKVLEITMRSTRVVTPDGRLLAVPNSTIINSTVASYTNFPHLRLDIEVQVGVNEDPQVIREHLLAVVAGDPKFMDEPAPAVAVTALGDFNNTFELRAWLSDETQHLVERPALRERVYVALNAAGVDMPYETLQLRPLEVQQVAPPTAAGAA